MIPGARARAHRQEAALIALERGWPVAASLRVGPPASIFNDYPRLFIGHYPGLADGDVDILCQGCRLLAGSVVVGDRIADETVSRSESVAILFQVQSLQFEAERVFAVLFGAGSVFWERLKQILSAAMLCALEQDRYMIGRKTLAGLSLQAAETLATGKTGPAKIAAIGLSLLAGGGEPTDLLQAIDAYNLARQLYDDLVDWRDDLATRRPSTLVARLAVARPHLLNGAPDLVARELYYGGHALAQLERALACAGQARAIGGLDAWSGVVRGLEKSCHDMHHDLSRIIARNLAA